MSVICRHAVLLTAATVVIGACTYDAGDTCDGDVCVNHAPSAVISDVADGALRVGSAGEVLISAHESSDPDGDVLSFVWTASAPCDTAVISDLTSQELRLDNLTIGSTCDVSLTVSDGRGLAASASATLIVRNVGGHVTIGSVQCVPTFDPASELAQGTSSTPFCSVDQALIAAKAYHLAEVSLEVGLHALVGPAALDFPVRIRGGYTVATSDWTHAGGGRSTLELRQALFTTADAELVVSGGVTLELKDLIVRRNGACRAACSLVTASDSSVELQSVTLGASSVITIPTANDAAGLTYASVELRATSDSAQHLAAEGLTIFGSANALTSIGVLVVGNIEVSLAGVTIHERALNSVAVRTLSAGDVTISDATLDVQPPLAATSQGFGILDGNRDTVSLEACSGSEVVCGSSRTLTIGNSTIAVTGADQVFGIDALGTDDVAVTGTSVTVDGQQAWAVLTSAVDSASLDDLVIDATTRRFRDGIQAFAVGISDNFDEATSAAAGSGELTVTRTQVDVHVVGNEITQAGGVNLVRSNNVVLHGNIIRVTGLSHTLSMLQNVAGIRLLTSQNVTILNSSVEVSGLRAEVGIAGIADGDGIVDGVPLRVGSENVTVSNVDVLTEVQGDLFATAACILLVDTRTARVYGGRGSGSMRCGASGPATTYGVLTTSGEDIEIRDLNLFVSSAPSISGVNDSTHVGIHDGGLLPTEVDRASVKLVISGNRIILDQANRKQIGVRIRGRSENSDPIIDDNFIAAKSGFKNVGVLLQATQATVALNSMRLAGCDATCTSPYAIGVYVMHADAFENEILGNAVSVFSSLDISERPAIVRHSTPLGDTLPDVGRGDGNLYASEIVADEAPFVCATTSDSTAILLPSTMTAYALADVPGTGNAAISALYCPDGIHGDPGGPQRGAAEVINTTFGVDIDGEQRDVQGLDAGADRIGAACP